jgi:hypothetical protein
VRCQFDDGWTPSHLSSGAANLYKEIAIALKAAEWRQPGLVALISKVATSAGEREPLKFNVSASYEPRTGPNSWAAARRDALPNVVPEVEGDNLMAQPDAPPAVATEVKGENVVAEQSTEPAMMMATLPETESPKAKIGDGEPYPLWPDSQRTLSPHCPTASRACCSPLISWQTERTPSRQTSRPEAEPAKYCSDCRIGSGSAARVRNQSERCGEQRRVGA